MSSSLPFYPFIEKWEKGRWKEIQRKGEARGGKKKKGKKRKDVLAPVAFFSFPL